MLNLALGSRAEIDGRTCILTWQGASGHAIYGPYQHLDPGYYAIEFNLAATEIQQLDGDEVCATVDVASGLGRLIFARQDVTLSRLRNGPVAVRLAFHTPAPGTFEFRVGVTGRIPLLIGDYCRILPLADADAEYGPLFDATEFPDPRALPKPAFFLDHLSNLRRLYENGAVVRIAGDDVVVTIEGVSFYVRISDDLRFIGEIFYRNTYNFLLAKPCCVIDIGMNIGLVSLTFARKAVVKEVHSFEPFKETYDRARANLSLNPEIAGKISAHNLGLSDVDEETTVLIQDKSDSGAFSIRGSERGTPEQISVRNAATVLKPIIQAARSKGRDIIAKVDCEGAEFAIFKTLEDHGLLRDISAFMVEWHAVIEGKTQRDLIAPLIRHGFIIFDLTGLTGNGFFYAVNSASAPL